MADVKAFQVDETIELDGGAGKVRVKFNNVVSKKIVDFRDALWAARFITSATITPVDPRVLLLVQSGIYDVQTAIKIVENEIGRYQQAALDDAMRCAMLGEHFTVRIGGGGQTVICDLPVELPENAFDDTQQNVSRYESGLPPLPVRNPKHPLEQRVAYIDALQTAYPRYAAAFENIFTKTVTEFLQVEFAEGLGKTDKDGFQSGNVDANTHGTAESIDKAGRRGSNRPRKVRASS